MSEPRSEPPVVAIDVSAVPAQPVGAGRYTLELVRALAASEEVSLRLLSRRDDQRRWEDLANARVLGLAPNRRLARLSYEQLALGKALRRQVPEASVLHAPHYNVAHGVKVPTVVTVHDLTVIDHPEWHERSKVLVFRRAIAYAAEHAAVIICPSRSTADRLRAHFAPVGAVHVIPHGIDHVRFQPVEPGPGYDADVLARRSIAGPFVLHLGAVEPRKNLPGLIGAFDVLADQHTDLRLVLAGPLVWGRSELERALASARHGARVEVLGYVDTTEVPALLRSAAVVVYPSFDEGFGLPPLEALACGAPVVTSRDSAMAEVVGDVAWLVKPGDTDELVAAIEAACAADRGATRERAVAQAASYTWERSASAHLEAYRLALGTL